MLKFIEKYSLITVISTILLAGVIWYLSSFPTDPVPSIGFKYKAYIYHFGIFFLLSLSTIILFSKGGKNKNGIGVAILTTILYAVIDEIHQYFVPGRGVSTGDFITDSLGIALAAVFYIIRIKNLNN